MKPTVKERFSNTEVLILDEISVVTYETFDHMDRLAKAAHEEPDKPFGGMQIIMFGDFCQLPPVRPHQHCFHCVRERTLEKPPRRKRGEYSPRLWRCPDHDNLQDGDRMWAFKSIEWEQVGFEYVALNQVHRQQDQVLLDILANVRYGKPFTKREVNVFMNHECDVTNAVELCSKRDEALRINRNRLGMLTAVEDEYECLDGFQ
jgi:ATP-dependent DNA helicase PIF1